MKKILALLLVAVLTLTAMTGLTLASSAEGETEVMSQEIKYFNVSLKTNVELLFAVPAAGYETTTDGEGNTTVPLQLLVWKSASASGRYSKADSNVAILETKGTLVINGVNHYVFTYDGLSAAEMSKVVYARALYTNEKGFRTYGDVYDYSIAEFANSYLNRDAENAAYVELVEAMMDYGHLVASYSGGKSYTAAEAKSLVKVRVTAKLGDTELYTQTTQLVQPNSTVTLTAPHVDGASFVSWGEGVTDGAIEVGTEAVNVVANYELRDFYSQNYEDAVTGSVIGAYHEYSGVVIDEETGTTVNGLPTSSASNQMVAYIPSYVNEAGETVAASTVTRDKFFGYWNISNNFCVTTKASPEYMYMRALIEESADGNKYLTFSHNGNGQTTWGSFVTDKAATTTGVGDTVGFSLSVDLMSGKDNKFPETYFRIDRQGNATSATGGGSPTIIKLNSNGSVTLGGTAVQYGNLNTNVIIAAGEASNTEFQKVTVVVDFANMIMKGYLNDNLVAVSSTPAELNPAGYLVQMDKNANTRFQLAVYGGYKGEVFTTAVKAAAQEATVMLDGVETNVWDSEANDWNYPALAKYVDENFYFSMDNLAITIGDVYK